MIRQQQQQQRQGGGGGERGATMTMQQQQQRGVGPPPPPNHSHHQHHHHHHHRGIMTAPRPRLHRLLSSSSDEEMETETTTSSERSSSEMSTSINHHHASSSIQSDPEELIRTQLFAPPAVIRNDVMGFKGPGVIMHPSYTRHHVHQPHMQQIHRAGGGGGGVGGGPHHHHLHHHHHWGSQGGRQGYNNNPSSMMMMPSSSIHATPSRMTRRGGHGGSKVTRTGNDQFCGLSAEITREIAYRTPAKTPAPPPPSAKTTPKGQQATNSMMTTPSIKKSVMTPLSRDLFRAKTSAPMTESKLMQIGLAKTESLSSSDDGSSPRDPSIASAVPNQQQQQQQSAAAPHATTAKKNGASPANLTLSLSSASKQRRSPTRKKKKVPPNLLDDTPNKQQQQHSRVILAEKKQQQQEQQQQRKDKPKIRRTPFPKRSARKKIKRGVTPPRRSSLGSHMNAPSSAMPSLLVSAAAAQTLSTAYDGVDDFRLTSTEHDPSPFQVELPSKKEIIAHSKICALMDGYTSIHRDFNFAVLSGVARTTLEREYERSTVENPMIAGSCHRDVVGQLLGCADDIVVEGFFREYTEECAERESERMEACIFSSEGLRQIIVCLRGSTANQAKPLSDKSGMFAGKQAASCILDVEQQVPVLSAFRAAYFGTPIERTVFALLANLTTRKPFFDVVVTGHSFGAAMATIAALRYATSNSQMRVACHVFGSPRTGGEAWRQLVHSVPNLRVYRAENGSDPYVSLPTGNEWVHCGHAIQIVSCDDNDNATTTTTTPLPEGEEKIGGKEKGAAFKARRFHRDEAPTSGSQGGGLFSYVQSKVIPRNLLMARGSAAQADADHEIRAYVERLTMSGDKWFADFCEVKGEGVSGADNERRILA